MKVVLAQGLPLVILAAASAQNHGRHARAPPTKPHPQQNKPRVKVPLSEEGQKLRARMLAKKAEQQQQQGMAQMGRMGPSSSSDMYSLSESQSARDLISLYSGPEFAEKVLNHGCWCAQLNTDIDHSALGGGTIDQVDHYCKQWIKEKKCLNRMGGSCYNYDTTLLRERVKKKIEVQIPQFLATTLAEGGG